MHEFPRRARPRVGTVSKAKMERRTRSSMSTLYLTAEAKVKLGTSGPLVVSKINCLSDVVRPSIEPMNMSALWSQPVVWGRRPELGKVAEVRGIVG